MAALPDTVRAFVVDRPEGGSFARGVRDLRPADLPPGDVTVRVTWSGVNFKDGLAAREDGKVARAYPLIPGIDLAGTVVESDDAAFPVGSAVLAHGYDIGVARHGGFGELARVPSAWMIRSAGRWLPLAKTSNQSATQLKRSSTGQRNSRYAVS